MRGNLTQYIIRALPLFMGIILLVLALLVFQQTQARLDDLSATIDSLESLDEPIPSEFALYRQMVEIQNRVEESEGRALNYLGFFEALGISITVVGIFIAVLGAIATNIGVSNYNDLLEQLKTTREEYESSQKKVEINQSKADELLENLRNSRNDIEKEIAKHISNTWEKAHLALSLIPLAERQYQSGNIDGALMTYERAVSLDSSNPVPYYYIGYIYTQKNAFDKAEKALRNALELDPEFHHARAALGFTLRRIGEQQKESSEQDSYFRQAEKLLKTALAANERLVDADSESWYGSLAGLYKREGDMESAIFYYEQASKVTPLSSYPAVNLAMIALNYDQGRVLERFAKVERLARLKIIAVLENYWGYGDLLLAQLALGKNKDAQETVGTLVDVIPPGVDDVLPRVRYSLNQLLEAKPFKGDKRDMNVIKTVIEYLNENNIST